MNPDIQLHFTDSLKLVIKAHNEIMDLYNDYLYEEGWNADTVKKFEQLLNIYNRELAVVKEYKDQYQWSDDAKQAKFEHFYNEILLPDNTAYNYAKIRHNAYLTYRAKRKSIIMLINDTLHLFTNQDIELLDYFNDKCAKVQLETPDIYHTPILKTWLKQNLTEVLHEIKNSYRITGKYSSETIERAFFKYVECRTIAYQIFNLLTSSNTINGYTKYSKFLEKYVNGNLSKAIVKHLAQSVKDEDDFIEFDDTQQAMDQHAWSTKGVFEGYDYWTLFNHDYKRDKKSVKKIDMIPSDANICKVYSDGKSVYAQRKFYKGDIIEICPCREISKQSLYTSDIRKLVFEVVPNEQYVIPMGYCQYYDISQNSSSLVLGGNCEYIWDPNRLVIVIKATKNIAKNEKLILNL